MESAPSSHAPARRALPRSYNACLRRGSVVLAVAASPLAACKSAPPEPEPQEERSETKTIENATGDSKAASTRAASTAARDGTPKEEPRKDQARPVASVPVTPGDPVEGRFTLEDATQDLPGDGALVAELETDAGRLECELFADKAPITVANFVGLARGLRPWKGPDGTWVKKPLYDGTPFHRIIRGFMIQGGDPLGTGAGGPGYVIPDEIWEGARHDERGLLCMANRGRNTNGSQFFILDGAAPHLDGGYTIFGKCKPESVIQTLASSKVRGDRAVDPPKLKRVIIKRAQ